MASTTTRTLLDPQFLKKLETLNLVTKKTFTGNYKGERRSVRRGSSIEFADYREYIPGDDLRYVDWKAYGRLDKLFLKLYVEEEDLNIHILIDTSQSMGFGSPMSKADYAKRVAAALGYIALNEYDRITVAPFSSTLGHTMPPVRGKQGISQFFDYLEMQTNPAGGTGFGDALTKYAARTKTRGIAIVISDFFDETYTKGIKALLARRFQVLLLHVLDEEELNPTLTGDLRLVDSETGEHRELSISSHIINEYQDALKQFCEGIRTMATRYGMDYLRVSTATPFEDLVLKSLRVGGLVR
jgi:uncharacterized protein (DUF58 family)